MERIEGEQFLPYVDRLTNALQQNKISYSFWENEVIGEHIYGEENLRRCSQFFKRFLEKLDFEECKELNTEKRLESIKKQKEELIKERKKLQIVNNEAQEYYRTLARQELFDEKIVKAIENLPELKIGYIKRNPVEQEKTGLLCISDLHAGSVYEIKGIFGEIVNKYDMDVMKTRMSNLTALVESDELQYNLDYDNLIVAICGDLFENALRMSSLSKLKEPVIDTVIETSEFLCQWISDLYNKLKVPIKVIIIGGNHDIVRMLSSKPNFEEENLAKIVVKFMQLRFANEKAWISIENYNEVNFTSIMGNNVMFYHGNDVDLQTTIEYYSNLYNIDIDEIYAGHFHRPESKAIGVADVGDRMIYRISSICGIDSYAKKLRKSARPGAYFALYEKENGHTWSKNYYLG